MADAQSNHLFNPNPINFISEPLFLGSGKNISRLDLAIEPHITKLQSEAMGKLWFSGDFSPSKDAKDYIANSKEVNTLFMKNLKFQTLLDSLAARSVAEVFLPITTNPQLENWWFTHAFFEGPIHSQSYADILKGLPVDAKAIFDDIMINPNILNRAKSIIACFEDTVRHNSRMILADVYNTGTNKFYNREAHKVSIVMSLFALNILEAVLFKSSFLTSYAFKENGMYSVTADIISKINQDEVVHYALSNYLINTLRKDPEWAYIFVNKSEAIAELYRTAIEADYAWIDYLFEDGARILGINDVIMKQYVTHNLHSVMKSVGQTPIVDKLDNPCTWASKYTRPSNIQTAQKEKTSGNYLLGIVKKDTTQEFWGNLI